MKKALIDNYTKEELEKIVKESKTYREVIIKLGYSSVTGGNNETLKNRIKKYNISTEHFNPYVIRSKKESLLDKDIFCLNSTVSQSAIRNHFKNKNYKEYKCEVCGLEPFWNGKPLTLTLDHINGNNKDNRIENLRWLCPNCDRQQPTFGAKNLKKLEKGKILISYNKNIDKQEGKKYNKISTPEREILKQKIFEYKNYTQCANYFNVSPTKLRNWCREYNLPTTISIVKHTTEDGWEKENWNDGYIPPKPPIKNNKPCAMLDKETEEIIKIFNSRHEAAKYISGSYNAESHIMAVCSGKRKTAYGYKWKDI